MIVKYENRSTTNLTKTGDSATVYANTTIVSVSEEGNQNLLKVVSSSEGSSKPETYVSWNSLDDFSISNGGFSSFELTDSGSRGVTDGSYEYVKTSSSLPDRFIV